MAKVKNNRYVMGYSEADSGIMVVYASSVEEAEELFENGEFVVEDLEF